MARYLVELPHSVEEHVQTLNEIAENPDNLAKFEFGCMGGEHTGFATIRANNESDARKIVPDTLRDRAKVIELNRFTPEEVKSLNDDLPYELMDYE